MERLQSIPDAGDYFDFSGRRFVGTARRMLRTVPAAEGLKQWDLWVAQGLAALAKLHDAGLIHGDIDPAALVINEEGNLRLGGLQKVHEDTSAPSAATTFHPNNLVLPPEQNLHAAFKDAVAFQAAYQSLQQANWPMDQLATIFPTIQFSRPTMFGLYELVQSEPAYRGMQRAGDVWMLGFALLSVYYEWLEWPYAASSEFYQTRHEAFHDVIEAMVRTLPADRISAEAALHMWAPSAAVPEMPNAPNAESTDVKTDVKTGGASETLPTKRRPYLTLQSHPAGRNKTRRSPRS